MRTLSIVTILLVIFSVFPPYTSAQENNTVTGSDTNNSQNFTRLLSQLTTRDFDKKAQIIQSVQQAQHKNSLLILRNLLDGNIYYKKDDKTIVIANIEGKQASITNAVTGEALGVISKRKIKKVGINNSLRRVLNQSIAQLSLNNDKASARKAAVVELFKSIDDDTAAILKQRLLHEQDSSVIEVLKTAISINALNSNDIDVQLNAIDFLSRSLYPEARNSLKTLDTQLSSQQQNSDITKLRQEISSSLEKINSSVGLYRQIENIFFGLSMGSVLLLVAVGLAITFGVMGVINMAHGEMLMLGAYTTYIIQQLFPNHIEYSILISIPTAFIFTGLVGIGIERGVIRFLYGRPLETLLATFGISLILQQTVRTVISPQNRAVSTPDWLSGSLQINPALSLTYNRLYIIIFAFMVLIGLMLLLNKSRFGLQVRAVTQNRSMAKAMGIRTDWVDAFTFGLGSGIAGIAGVALSQLTNVGPNLGQSYIIDSFMVVVFGGVGNLWGTLFGAMTLGIANKYLEPFTGAVIAKILVLVFIILFIQKRPRGMFALKGRSADN